MKKNRSTKKRSLYSGEQMKAKKAKTFVFGKQEGEESEENQETEDNGGVQSGFVFGKGDNGEKESGKEEDEEEGKGENEEDDGEEEGNEEGEGDEGEWEGEGGENEGNFDNMDIENNKRANNNDKNTQKKIIRSEKKRIMERVKKEKKLEDPHEKARYEANVLWQKLRKRLSIEKSSDINKETIQKILEITKGKIYKMIYKPDTSRVLQLSYKLGSDEQKALIFEELKDHIVEMSQMKYQRFLINKLLKYSNEEQRNYIISRFYGKIVILTKHMYACEIIDRAFLVYCNKQQQLNFLAEFLDKEKALFQTGENLTFEQLIAKNPFKRENIMTRLRKLLLHYIKKPDLIENAILHYPFMIYMKHGDSESIKEMVDLTHDITIRFVHTRMGAQVATTIIGRANPKQRKTIVKEFKPYAEKILLDEFGNLVMLKLFLSTDDIVTLRKLLKDILNINSLFYEKRASTFFLGLLEGVISKYFSDFGKELLAPTMIPDPNNQTALIPTSKKNPEEHQKELRKMVLPPLVGICDKNSFEFAISKPAQKIWLETFRHANEENKKTLRTSLSKWVNFDIEDFPEEKAKRARKYHPLEEKPLFKEDLMVQDNAHKLLSVLVSEDPIFAEELAKFIEGKEIFYASNSNSAPIMRQLIKTQNKIYQHLKQNKKKIENQDNENIKSLLDEIK